MARIVSGIRSVSDGVGNISSSSREQSAGIGDISGAMARLDEITGQNSQMVVRAVEQTRGLEARASSLSHAIGNFKLQQGVADEAMELVTRALDFRRRCASRDDFLKGLTDKGNAFFDRDMYVFVLDTGGTYRAFGGNPAKVGTRVQDIPGVKGQQLLDDILAQAARGTGWVEYDIANPTTGVVQAKMSYVSAIPGFEGLALGCGVYKNLIAT
jgi:signal transduction histidine kinase